MLSHIHSNGMHVFCSTNSKSLLWRDIKLPISLASLVFVLSYTSINQLSNTFKRNVRILLEIVRRAGRPEACSSVVGISDHFSSYQLELEQSQARGPPERSLCGLGSRTTSLIINHRPRSHRLMGKLISISRRCIQPVKCHTFGLDFLHYYCELLFLWLKGFTTNNDCIFCSWKTRPQYIELDSWKEKNIIWKYK